MDCSGVKFIRKMASVVVTWRPMVASADWGSGDGGGGGRRRRRPSALTCWRGPSHWRGCAGAPPAAGGGARRPPAGGNPREARGCREEQAHAETLGWGGAGGRGRGCGEEQARGCREGARVREAASAGQPDGVGGEESAQQQTTPMRPFFYSRDDL